MSPLRILVLDDSLADAELMARELERSGVPLDWRWASTEREFVEALGPDLDAILADYSLPGFNALAALEHLKRRELGTPFIIVTGMLGDEAAVDCIKQGATDYLLKDRLKRLGPAVMRAIEDRRAAVERESAEERLRQSKEAASEALRRANADLERHVAERTRALTEANEKLHLQVAERRQAEEQLHQAQKMEALGQLTGGMAHDFNNLLTAVIGNIDLAMRRETAESVARLLRGAMQGAERGARLTSQLLAFGRRQALTVGPVDLNRLIANLEPMLVSTLTPAIRIDKSLQPDLLPALADTTQIELALINLAINARDAMPNGGSLTISTRFVDATEPDRPIDLGGDAPGYVALTVTDSGVGMPPEVAARAFEPFFTTKGVGKGSGLGLSMVYGLAKQLGGTATLESKVGQGTVVAIYVPMVAEALVETREDYSTDRVDPAACGRPVLVVDDDAMVRDTTCTSLREFGYEVMEAGDGASALRILDSGCAVDVLVTDLVMPGMSGSALSLQARKRRPNLPIIVMTGYSAAGLEPEGFDFPVLQKPFRPAQLAAMVAECRPR
ncbi:response regulator [Phenylobacterium sp. LjRoot225]|uniref:response regulator n=1 Tax=Phenylobacterium sp. LjRoot225 TaxID=3342285 RepID=UPI003ED13D70